MKDAGQDATAMKDRAARHAARMVEDGMVVGLGSGSTALLFVRALAERVQQGLRMIGVPTSEATAALAASLGLHLATLEDYQHLDLAIDGADEVDPDLNLIKGLGGALLREKIVASSAAKLAIMVDESKLVDRLGQRAPVPVEVVPFGWIRTRDALAALGATVERRSNGEKPFITDGDHFILDCHFDAIADTVALGIAVKAITGVVDHGLFIGMAGAIIVGHPDRIELRVRVR